MARMTVRGWAGAALIALTLAGCGGSSSPKANATSGDGGEVSAVDTARSIGCSGIDLDQAGDRELYVADSGTCSVSGMEVTIYRFSNNASRDNWISVARGNGIGRFVVFDRGVITSDDQGAADKVAGAVHGEIRT